MAKRKAKPESIAATDVEAARKAEATRKWDEAKSRLDDLVKERRITGWAPDIRKICLAHLACCGATFIDSLNRRPAEPTDFPAAWKTVRRRRAIDAAQALCLLADIEDFLQQGMAESAAVKTLALGAVMSRLGYRADEQLAADLRAKNKAFVGPQLAVGQANREAVLKSFARHNRDGLCRKAVIARVTNETGLARSKVYKHLAAAKESSPQR